MKKETEKMIIELNKMVEFMDIDQSRKRCVAKSS